MSFVDSLSCSDPSHAHDGGPFAGTALSRACEQPKVSVGCKDGSSRIVHRYDSPCSVCTDFHPGQERATEGTDHGPWCTSPPKNKEAILNSGFSCTHSPGLALQKASPPSTTILNQDARRDSKSSRSGKISFRLAPSVSRAPFASRGHSLNNTVGIDTQSILSVPPPTLPVFSAASIHVKQDPPGLSNPSTFSFCRPVSSSEHHNGELGPQHQGKREMNFADVSQTVPRGKERSSVASTDVIETHHPALNDDADFTTFKINATPEKSSKDLRCEKDVVFDREMETPFTWFHVEYPKPPEAAKSTLEPPNARGQSLVVPLTNLDPYGMHFSWQSKGGQVKEAEQDEEWEIVQAADCGDYNDSLGDEGGAEDDS
nr:hypothetical protein CFP56_66994 [Quercus suber]